jgi:hypothetical protein
MSGLGQRTNTLTGRGYRDGDTDQSGRTIGGLPYPHRRSNKVQR